MPTTGPPKTKPSTARLSEVARHIVIPDGITSTGWPAVEKQCAKWGDEFDQWQVDAGRLILAKRDDGSYAATIGGVVISIPRQVAKTFLVGRIIFALCVLFPGLTVVWTAHRTRTATQTFQKLKGLAKRPAVASHISHVRNVNGEQEIGFLNGSVIMFGAREQGFGRGFDEVDVEVFDEAQILTVKAVEDMVAATNQSRHPHGALLFYMGTPPRPVDPGEVFTERRDEALQNKVDDVDDFGGPVVGDDTLYIECSADSDADPNDREQWAKANPSYPHRTPLRSLLRLRKNLPDDDSWRREGLGIWGDTPTKRTPIIDASTWADLTLDDPPRHGELAYGVKFSTDGHTVALAVALRPDEGPVHVEGVEHRLVMDGTDWLVDWLVERRDEARMILVDGKAGAGALVDELHARKVWKRRAAAVSAEQAVKAHATMLAAVTAGTVSHFGDETLNTAVAAAGRRPIGKTGGWGIESITGDDVTLFEAVILAHYAATMIPRRRGSSSQRRIAVLT